MKSSIVCPTNTWERDGFWGFVNSAASELEDDLRAGNESLKKLGTDMTSAILEEILAFCVPAGNG